MMTNQILLFDEQYNLSLQHKSTATQKRSSIRVQRHKAKTH